MCCFPHPFFLLSTSLIQCVYVVMTASLKPVAALSQQCTWTCKTIYPSSHAPFICPSPSLSNHSKDTVPSTHFCVMLN